MSLRCACLLATCLVLPLTASTAGEPKQPSARRENLPPGAIARLGTLPLRFKGRGAYVVFSPDGRTLAVYGLHSRIIRLLDPVTGKERGRIEAPRPITTPPVFSPDGTAVAAGAGSRVHLWDRATGQQRREFSHAGAIVCVDFVGGGKTLAAGSASGIVHWWEVGTGQLVRTWDGEAGGPPAEVPGRDAGAAIDLRTFALGGYHVAWQVETEGPKGQLSRQRAVMLWDELTADRLVRREGEQAAQTYALSPTGEMLAVVYGWRIISSTALRWAI
jgi:hypothetical protein